MVNTLLAVTKLTWSSTAHSHLQSIAFNVMLLILRVMEFVIRRALTVHTQILHNNVDFGPRAITQSKYHSLTHCLLWSNTVEIVTSLFALAFNDHLNFICCCLCLILYARGFRFQYI